MMTKVIRNNKQLQFSKKIGLKNINSEEVLDIGIDIHAGVAPK